MSTRLFVEECFDGKHADCKGYNGPADNPNFRCDCDCHKQPAEDDRVKEVARQIQQMYRSMNASLGYKHYEPSVEAIEQLLLSLLPVQPATCPKCGHSETDANGWCMSGRPYIANEPDSNKRSICSCRCVQPAASTPTEAHVHCWHTDAGGRFCCGCISPTEASEKLSQMQSAASTEAQDERK